MHASVSTHSATSIVISLLHLRLKGHLGLGEFGACIQIEEKSDRRSQDTADVVRVSQQAGPLCVFVCVLKEIKLNDGNTTVFMNSMSDSFNFVPCVLYV